MDSQHGRGCCSVTPVTDNTNIRITVWGCRVVGAVRVSRTSLGSWASYAPVWHAFSHYISVLIESCTSERHIGKVFLPCVFWCAVWVALCLRKTSHRLSKPECPGEVGLENFESVQTKLSVKDYCTTSLVTLFYSFNQMPTMYLHMEHILNYQSRVSLTNSYHGIQNSKNIFQQYLEWDLHYSTTKFALSR